MSLQFALAGPQIKYFKVMLQSLSKTNATELLIEALPDQLILSSINSSRSAYLAITLGSEFFDEYRVGGRVVQNSVLLKDALVVLASNKVVRVSFELAQSDERLSARVYEENGLKKVYGIVCLDTPVLSADIPDTDYPVSMVAGGAELQRLFSSFQSAHKELTIVAHPWSASDSRSCSCELRTFHGPAGSNQTSSSLRTELSFSAESLFLLYEHTSQDLIHATFDMQDFRAAVYLCGQLGADVCIKLHSPGIPMIVEPRWPPNRVRRDMILDMAMRAKLILATLPGSQINSSIERHGATMEDSSVSYASHRRGSSATGSGVGGVHVPNAGASACFQGAPTRGTRQPDHQEAPRMRNSSSRNIVTVPNVIPEGSEARHVGLCSSEGSRIRNEANLWDSQNESRQAVTDNRANFVVGHAGNLLPEGTRKRTISQVDPSPGENHSSPDL